MNPKPLKLQIIFLSQPFTINLKPPKPPKVAQTPKALNVFLEAHIWQLTLKPLSPLNL